MTNTSRLYGTTSASFKNYMEAERYYNELKARGYDSNDISIFMSDKTRDALPSHLNVTDNNDVMEWVGTGSAIGGTAGGIIGAIAALGTAVVFPVAGLVVAGPILGALAGAGAGWLVGGITGALVNSGLSTEDADAYADKINNGEIVIVVDPRSEDDSRYIDTTTSKYDKTHYSNTYKA